MSPQPAQQLSCMHLLILHATALPQHSHSKRTQQAMRQVPSSEQPLCQVHQVLPAHLNDERCSNQRHNRAQLPSRVDQC
jgi:hypothetical protein